MSDRTAGQLVYAIGDIHGRYDLTKRLLAQIAADCAVHAAGRRPVLVFLGDYVDRGPQSNQVLEALLWLRRRADLEVRLLKGNHEQALLMFLDRPEEGGGWLRYGGLETLAAYGVPPPRPEDGARGLTRARDELLEHMPASHLWLLQQLELMLAVGDYCFVHAGVRPGAPLAAQAEEDVLWIRQVFLEAPGPHEKVIVHGHTWLSEQPQLHAHRLGLDTGAYATGVLTAARLDGDQQAILQARIEQTAAAAAASRS